MSTPLDLSEGSNRPSTLLPATAGGLLAAAVSTFFAATLTSQYQLAPSLNIAGASLLIAATTFFSAWLHEHDRAAPMRALERPNRRNDRDEGKSALERFVVAQAERGRALAQNIDWRGWAPTLLLIGGNAAAIAIIIFAGRTGEAAQPSVTVEQVVAGLFIVASFPLLVLERTFAGLDNRKLPVAPRLSRTLRIPLASLVGLGIAYALSSLGFSWPILITFVVDAFLLLASAEILVRSVAQLFLPLPATAERQVPASLVAGLVAFSRPGFGELTGAIQREFGIDLSRSWALGFVRRAALPITGGLLAFSWLLTGVTALGIDQRAVYEAFGIPVSVLGPGLHVHLPWPFGVLRNVELGVVHEIPIVFPTQGGETLAEIAASESAERGTAEAPPPPSADRLWDATHPAEASYLIASQAGGQQSFEIVNIDLRIVYRTGVSDDAALAAAYRVSDPEVLIRAASGRMLVRHFSRYTLSDVLGENRDRFVAAFRDELQARLDELHTGVEVIAVVVEAIHPPPGAATSYQNVQAAEINSHARVSLARGDAVRTLASAQQTAIETQNAATASAAEQVERAHADSTLFAGDKEAHAQGGQAFLFERWLDRLSKSLTVAPLIVVDHRLGGQNVPTVDLRRFGEKAAADQTIIPEE